MTDESNPRESLIGRLRALYMRGYRDGVSGASYASSAEHPGAYEKGYHAGGSDVLRAEACAERLAAATVDDALANLRRSCDAKDCTADAKVDDRGFMLQGQPHVFAYCHEHSRRGNR